MIAEPVPLDVQVDRSGSTMTIYVSGDLDIASAPALVEQATGPIDGRTPRIFVDLSEVHLCDSAGMNALVQIQRHVESVGAELTLYEIPELLGRAMEVAGLDQVLKVVGRRRRG